MTRTTTAPPRTAADDKELLTMSRMLFVNLPVADLATSMAFFQRLGFAFNPDFTDANAACMVVGADAYVMLLRTQFYRSFTDKSVTDTDTHTEAIFCVSADSRDEVDRLVHTALEAGGRASRDKLEDGPMYGWSFQDLDGHLWEVMHMDLAATHAE